MNAQAKPKRGPLPAEVATCRRASTYVSPSALHFSSCGVRIDGMPAPLLSRRIRINGGVSFRCGVVILHTALISVYQC